MRQLRYILVVVLCSVTSFIGVAQTAKSAYFLDGTFHNYLLNPAMDAERAYFTILGGNLSFATNGNVGISNFIYPYGDDKLTTFMSGTVSQSEFLNRLPKSVKMSADINMTLLAAGFRMFNGYTNISLSLNSAVSTNLPKGLFEFAKKGFQESAYCFSDINMRTMNYAALTVGHSREIIDGLRVGINAKYLLGLAYANLHVDKLNIELSEKQWMIESHASAEAAMVVESNMSSGEDGTVENVEVPVFNGTGPFKPVASGFAIDLGAVYDLSEFVEGLTVSASIVDLGTIKWKNMMMASTRDTKVVFKGFSETTPEDLGGSVNEELEELGDDASEMIDLYADGVEVKNTALSATMYVGAEYSMPFYRPLSAALLYGKRFGNFGGWNDIRGYVNVVPLKWFEASANVGFSTFGTSLGWMINFHPVGFNLFIGSDYMITKVTPQFIPVNNLNGHITMGINFPIGARK